MKPRQTTPLPRVSVGVLGLVTIMAYGVAYYSYGVLVDPIKASTHMRAHVTPHTFRRTYITFMVAAGYDIPYVQAQVGHKDPTTTLAIYAQVMRRPDRDQLRAEIRALLGVTPQPPEPPAATVHHLDRGEGVASVDALRGAEKAGKGRAIGL